MKVNTQELVNQMEQVAQALETTDRTSPLADLIGDWVRAVEWLGEEVERLQAQSVADAGEVVKAIESAVSSAKGMQPIDHRSE